MSAHDEKALHSDGRKRQRGQKKEKQDLYGKSTDLTIVVFIIYTL